jgi:hypothetical protein
VTSATAVAGRADTRPRLLFFYSRQSGRSRRTEGFLAQVLQRRRNYRTFRGHRIEASERPELVDRLRVERVPTLLVVDEKRVRVRVEEPRGCAEIEKALRPWLR